MIRWFTPLLLCSCADLIGITEPRDLEVVELVVSAGTLVPAFDPAVSSYALKVGYPDATFEVHAAANDPEARIDIAGVESVAGSGVAAVEIGDTTIEVVARTASGVTRTYEIAVTRADLIIAFAAPRMVPTQIPGMVDRVAIADFDGDGTPDLGAMTGTGELGLLTNSGAAQFMFRGTMPYGVIRAIATRDLDLDGKPDLLVIGGSGLQIGRGLGNAQFEAPISCGGPPMPTAFSLFQFDSDGRVDLAIADTGGRLAPMIGMPGMCFQSMPAIEQNVSPTQLTVVASGPIDNSLGDDLATLDPMQGQIFVHRNFGGNALSIEPLETGVGAHAVELVVADLDGDQHAEVIWIDRTTDDVVIQRFPGPRGPSYRVPGNPRSLTVVDIDGDGALDVLVLDNAGITVLHNEAGGTFSKKSVPMAMPGVMRLAAADLDGDGRADLATANFTSTILVHLGVAP